MRSPTQVAEITIQYVNQPKGKGPGSIKDSRGAYWKVWPDKMELFEGREGQTVAVTYYEEEYEGKPQCTVIGIAGGRVRAVPRRGPRLVPPAPPPSSGISPAEKDDRIAVLALVKGVPEFGVVASNGDVQKGIQILRTLRAIWHGFTRPNGPAPRPSLQQELDDEIPDFSEPVKNIEDTF